MGRSDYLYAREIKRFYERTVVANNKGNIWIEIDISRKVNNKG